MNSVEKESTDKRCLLILHLKPLKGQRKQSMRREFQNLAKQEKKVLTETFL